MSNRCNACGVLFADHLGIQGTCQDNLRLRAALIALVGMLKQERQFCDTIPVVNAERVLDGIEGEQCDGVEGFVEATEKDRNRNRV